MPLPGVEVQCADAAQTLELSGAARCLPETVCYEPGLPVRARYRDATELILKVSDVAISRGKD